MDYNIFIHIHSLTRSIFRTQQAPAGRTPSSDPPVVGSLERLETQPEEPAEGDPDAIQSTSARTNGATREPEVIIKVRNVVTIRNQSRKD